MGKCKWCNKPSKLNSFGYCDTCYDDIRSKIANTKTELEALEQRAKLDLPADEKQQIVDRTVQYQKELKAYKDRGVPFFKSDITALCDGIFAKMGVEYHFPHEILISTKKKVNIPVVLGFAICLITIGIYAHYYANLVEEKQSVQAQLDTAIFVMAAQDDKIIELQASLEKLSEPASATRSYTLQNGNFVSGKNFTPGTYNISAVSGQGNVFSDNAYDGGINALMGTGDTTGFYEKQYKNIRLPEGTVLTIDRVKIRLTLVE